MSKCVPKLRNVCNNSTLRAAKTVRATMLSMAILLAADPDVRVIHLLRDPRGVASSRREAHDESVIGRFAMTGRGVGGGVKNASSAAIRREAGVYCRTAATDIRVRRALEAKYPGRILTLYYENVVGDLLAHADAVYRFLGESGAPTETRTWVAQNEAAIARAAHRPGYASPVNKWAKRLSAADSEAIISQICREYFQLVGETGSGSTVTKATDAVNSLSTAKS
jgi:Sulfotransferase family